LYSILCNKQR
jgi:hypothetical protein